MNHTEPTPRTFDDIELGPDGYRIPPPPPPRRTLLELAGDAPLPARCPRFGRHDTSDYSPMGIVGLGDDLTTVIYQCRGCGALSARTRGQVLAAIRRARP